MAKHMVTAEVLAAYGLTAEGIADKVSAALALKK